VGYDSQGNLIVRYEDKFSPTARRGFDEILVPKRKSRGDMLGMLAGEIGRGSIGAELGRILIRDIPTNGQNYIPLSDNEKRVFMTCYNNSRKRKQAK